MFGYELREKPVETCVKYDYPEAMATSGSKKAGSSKAKSLSFEEAMERLESLVKELEGGELGIEESIRLYEKGIELRDLCAKHLREAELKVEQLTVKDGKITGSKPYSSRGSK